MLGGLGHVYLFHILGISESQLTNSYFFSGVAQPPTRTCTFQVASWVEVNITDPSLGIKKWIFRHAKQGLKHWGMTSKKMAVLWPRTINKMLDQRLWGYMMNHIPWYILFWTSARILYGILGDISPRCSNICQRSARKIQRSLQLWPLHPFTSYKLV